MIGSLRGKVTWKSDKVILIDVAGVGYKVSAGAEAIHKAKEGIEISLFIHTHVKEDAIDLYGFLDHAELEFFEMLIGVSGIGPKSAIVILGIASIPTLSKAISTGDISYLTKISGIGKKTAEKIVIELRDKLGEEKSDGSLQGELDAMEALKSLGYSQSDAREALKKVSVTDTNSKVREALKILGGHTKGR